MGDGHRIIHGVAGCRNRRLSRLLSQLMALQAGLPLLNFSVIKGKQREAYFAAVRAGMGRDYAPMIEVLGKW